MKDKFLSACSENEVSEVRELLDRGAEVNWRDQDGYSGQCSVLVYTGLSLVIVI